MYETQPDGGSSHGKVSQETLLSSGILSSYHLHLKLGGDVKHSNKKMLSLTPVFVQHTIN